MMQIVTAWSASNNPLAPSALSIFTCLLYITRSVLRTELTFRAQRQVTWGVPILFFLKWLEQNESRISACPTSATLPCLWLTWHDSSPIQRGERRGGWGEAQNARHRFERRPSCAHVVYAAMYGMYIKASEKKTIKKTSTRYAPFFKPITVTTVLPVVWSDTCDHMLIS